MTIVDMIVYTTAGALFGVAILLLFKFCKSKGLTGGKLIGSYALMLFGALLIGFSIDWGWGSIVEGEPQSAAIGFLVFGGLGIVFALIGFRLATAKAGKTSDTKAAE